MVTIKYPNPPNKPRVGFRSRGRVRASILCSSLVLVSLPPPPLPLALGKNEPYLCADISKTNF